MTAQRRHTDGDVNTKQLITVKSRSVRAHDSREMTTSLNLDKCHLDLLRVRHMFGGLLQSSRDLIDACIVSCCRPHWSFIHHSSSQQLPAQALKDRMKIQPKYLTFFFLSLKHLINSELEPSDSQREYGEGEKRHITVLCTWNRVRVLDMVISPRCCHIFFAHIWHW